MNGSQVSRHVPSFGDAYPSRATEARREGKGRERRVNPKMAPWRHAARGYSRRGAFFRGGAEVLGAVRTGVKDRQGRHEPPRGRLLGLRRVFRVPRRCGVQLNRKACSIWCARRGGGHTSECLGGKGCRLCAHLASKWSAPYQGPGRSAELFPSHRTLVRRCPSRSAVARLAPGHA
jgi:hypothetical protein